MRTSTALISLGFAFLTVSEQEANAVVSLPKNPSLYGQQTGNQNLLMAPKEDDDSNFDIESAPVPDDLRKDIGRIAGLDNATLAIFRKVGDNPEIFAANETSIHILSINKRDNVMSFSASSAVEYNTSNTGKPLAATLVLTQIFDCNTNKATTVTTLTGPEHILLMQKTASSSVSSESVKQACGARDEIVQVIESGLKLGKLAP